jgi:hypothetical protein
MGNKINIAELLKECPKGMELDCVMFNNVTLECVEVGNIEYPIEINIQSGEDTIELTEYGCWDYSDNAKCVIFPKGKTTWEGFVPPVVFKDGDIVSAFISSIVDTWIGIFKQYENGETFETYCSLSTIGEFHNTNSKRHLVIGTHLATEEEKQKLFDAIKRNGYRWNGEKKCLEKLKAHKFDINTLVPFEDKVLVRDEITEKWMPATWGFYDDSVGICYTVEGGNEYNMCIPYKGNEHLLGTTDDCENYFKNWED